MCPRYAIYDYGSEFELHFRAFCDDYRYGIKPKPTMIKNLQANTMLEHAGLEIRNKYAYI